MIYIYACGTARKHRKNISVHLQDDKQLNRGDFDDRASTEDVVCLKWKDSKRVLFLENFHDPSHANTVGTWKKKDGSKKKFASPQLV